MNGIIKPFQSIHVCEMTPTLMQSLRTIWGTYQLNIVNVTTI